MTDPWRALDRSALDRHTLRVLRKAGGTRPEIREIDFGGKLLVLKDYAPLRGSLMGSLGRVAIAREAAALRALAHLEGVVRLHARLDAYALLTELVPGELLSKTERNRLSVRLFDELRHILEGVHRSGYVLWDLRAKNVLVHPEGRPVLIDFATAIALPAPLHAYSSRLDQRKLAKLIWEYAPECATARDRSLLHYRYPLEGSIRRFGKPLKRSLGPAGGPAEKSDCKTPRTSD